MVVRNKFSKKRIHLSIISGLYLEAIPMENQINESVEDNKLIKTNLMKLNVKAIVKVKARILIK